MRRTILYSILGALLVGFPLQAESPSLTPVRLSGKGADVTWAGQQFLQADQKGRVFLLDAAHLRVYPVVGDGIGAPAVLVRDGDKTGASQRGFVMSAALSPDGRDWLLQLFPDALRYFRSGEERSLPVTPWAISAVALPDGRPVVAVGLGSRGPLGAAERDEDPPLLLGLSDLQWEALVREPYDASILPDEGKGPMNGDSINRLKASRDFVLARGAKGRIWLASRNQYRVRVYSAAGRLLDELKTGPQRIELRKRSEKELDNAKRSAGEAASERDQKWIEYIASSPTPKAAIEAFAVDPATDTLFLITSSGGQEGHQLDRFDRAAGRLERTGLRLPEVKGRLQAVAGKDGLYLADSSGSGGRWLLSWDAMEQAKWKQILPALGGLDTAR